MPSWMAWAQRPRGLIKVGRKGSTFKVENVSWKRISIIDLDHYQIHVYFAHLYSILYRINTLSLIVNLKSKLLNNLMFKEYIMLPSG
jgi:hypothetical protein